MSTFYKICNIFRAVKLLLSSVSIWSYFFVCYYLKFEDRARFMFSRQEMEALVGGEISLIGKELKVTGLVKDWWLNDTASGYQSAIVYSKTPDIRFLEGSVVSFKPDAPFKVHVSSS